MGSSQAHRTQPGTLLAERSIVCPRALITFFDTSTRLTRKVVMVNGRFPRALLGFNGEPWAVDHEVCLSLTGFAKKDRPKAQRCDGVFTPYGC